MGVISSYICFSLRLTSLLRNEFHRPQRRETNKTITAEVPAANVLRLQVAGVARGGSERDGVCRKSSQLYARDSTRRPPPPRERGERLGSLFHGSEGGGALSCAGVSRTLLISQSALGWRFLGQLEPQANEPRGAAAFAAHADSAAGGLAEQLLAGSHLAFRPPSPWPEKATAARAEADGGALRSGARRTPQGTDQPPPDLRSSDPEKGEKMDAGPTPGFGLKDVKWSSVSVPLDLLVSTYRLPQVVRLDGGE